jgi:replication-associated recombination protein RarA
MSLFMGDYRQMTATRLGFWCSAVSLSEKVRPRCWSEVVGQARAVSTLQRLESAGGLAGRAYLLIGKSGTGKTTLGRIIAASVAPPLAICESNAQDLALSDVRDMESEWTTTVLPHGERGLSGRAYLFNEAHLLRGPIVSRLLTTLEAIPRHVAVIFTTTNDGEEALFEDYADAGPLTSRCTTLRLQSNGFADAAAERLQQIAQAEGLDGKPLADYKRLIQRHRQNMRAALAEIESGAFMA